MPLLDGLTNPLLSTNERGKDETLLSTDFNNKDLLMLDKDETESLDLVDGYGFPEEKWYIVD